jgi:hypothetical protein
VAAHIDTASLHSGFQWTGEEACEGARAENKRAARFIENAGHIDIQVRRTSYSR